MTETNPIVDATTGHTGRLSHNPFAQASDEFFEGAGRQGALEQLRHLSRWTRRLLVVTGPRGIGKSTLYRALSANLDPRARAARINGTFVTSDRDVMVSIAQGFGIAIPAGATGQLLFELVAGGVAEATAGERVCMVLIDDAQLLDARAVDQLLNVIAQQDLRVVCFAEREFVGALQRSAKRLAEEVPWHELSLPLFDAEQTASYLEWRCNQAGYGGGTPFSDETIERIAEASGGLPAKVNALANEALTQQGLTPDRSTLAIPHLHRAIAVALVVVLVAIYFVWPAGEQASDRPMSEFELAHGGAVSAAEPASEAQVATPAEPSSEADGRSDLARETIDAIAANAIAPAISPQDDVEELENEQVSPSNTAEVSSQQDAAEPAEAEPTVSDTASAPSQTEPESSAEPAPQPTQQAVARPVPVNPIRIEDRSQPAPGAWRDGDWLLGQSDERFTIQLLGSGDAERVRDYLQRQADPKEFATYRTRSGDRVLYIVVYGLFTDRDAALAAAAELPPETGRVDPWVRKLSAVKTAVRAGR